MVQRLLDKLLARQNKLMHRLQDRPEKVTRRVASPQLQARRTPGEPGDAERAAAEAAMRSLVDGAVEEAEAAVRPFESTAQWSMTLVLLGRIAVLRHEHERALEFAVRAEAQDSLDPSVTKLMADVHCALGNKSEEIRYRRMRVFAQAEPKAADVVALARAVVEASQGRSKPAAKELRLASNLLERLGDAHDEDRLAFAEVAFQLREVDAEARRNYVEVSPPTEDEYDCSANWVRLITYANRRALPVQRDVGGGVPSRRPTMAELSNVYVDPRFDWIPIVEGGTVALSDCVGRRPRLRSSDLSSPLLLSSQTKAFLRLRKDALEVDVPAVVVGGSHDALIHALESLGGLAVAEKLGLDRSVRLAVNADLSSVQLERFSALGYGEDRLLRLPTDRPVVFDCAFVVSKPTFEGVWVDSFVPEWFRRRLGGTPAQNVAGRIHLTDAGAPIRSMDEALAGCGFMRVDPARLPLGELVSLLLGARWIAGADGGSMSAILHAPADAHVLYTTPTGRPSKSSDAIRALSTACGQSFTLLSEASSAAEVGEALNAVGQVHATLVQGPSADCTIEAVNRYSQ